MKLIFWLSLFLPLSVEAAIKVVTSSTDLAWAAEQVGGDKVEVKSLLRGRENAHFVDAVPEFIRLSADAQVVCIVGLDLEVGWMPKVLARSGNAAVQPGGKGYCDTGKMVEVLEKPTGPVDRSMGDVHPAGNPHYWTSPEHLAQASRAIRDTLIAVDATNMKIYTANQKSLEERLKKFAAANKAKFAPIVKNAKGPLVMEYHKEFTYFLAAYGIPSFGSLEEKPGVPPSAARIAETSLGAKAAGVKLLLAAQGSPAKTLQRFTELSGIPTLVEPVSLQAADGKLDYFKVHGELVESVLRILSKDNERGTALALPPSSKQRS